MDGECVIRMVNLAFGCQKPRMHALGDFCSSKSCRWIKALILSLMDDEMMAWLNDESRTWKWALRVVRN